MQEKTITETMKIYGTGISVYLYVVCVCVFFCVCLFKIWISPLTFQMVFILYLFVFFSSVFCYFYRGFFTGSQLQFKRLHLSSQRANHSSDACSRSVACTFLDRAFETETEFERKNWN